MCVNVLVFCPWRTVLMLFLSFYFIRAYELDPKKLHADVAYLQVLRFVGRCPTNSFFFYRTYRPLALTRVVASWLQTVTVKGPNETSGHIPSMQDNEQNP